MSYNTFGKFFRVTTWGESHGPAIGGVVDGCPPGIPLTEEDIQPYLDKRKPGQSEFTTQRKESDQVKILSGVFEGKTTGHPISLVIENTDQRSKDYGDIMDVFRPGHADFTYQLKYGIRDYRGGGRASARETAMRVAAGAIARKVLDAQLEEPMLIKGALVQLGEKAINHDNWDWNEVDQNPFFCPDPQAVPEWESYLKAIRKDQDSVGAVIEVVAAGAPIGLGEPVYGKLDTELAAAMMSINAVKGVEIGNGFGAASLKGSENADEIRMNEDGTPEFLSNNAGGILGGISNGEEILVRFAVKATSSILKAQKSITKEGEETDVSTKGRHDPCVGIRAVPVGEAMMALVLADQLLRHKAQCA